MTSIAARVPFVRSLSLSLVLGACTPADEPGGGEEGSSSGGDDSPHTVLLAPVSGSICDTVGVISVQVRATKVGCEHPPPAPCTLPADPPPVEGDMVSCPITDGEVTLGVRVDQAAAYAVEVVADRTPDDPTTECFAESVMATSVLVTSVDLDVGSQKMLVGTGAPCPAP